MKQSETQDEGVVAGPEIQATGGDDLKGEYDLEAGTVNGVNHSKAPLESEFVNLTRWQATRIFWKSTVLCVMAMVAVLMDGYAQSIPGSIVSNQGFINQFGTIVNAKTGKLSLNAHYVSIWGGIVGVGILVGQQMGSILADKYGRTLSRIFLTVVFAGAILGMQFAKDWKGWLGAKLLLGLGQGLVQSTTLTYVVEIAPLQTRGALVAMYGIFLGLGQLVSAISLQVLAVTKPTNYKNALYSIWLLEGLWILCIPFLPESPWWHARSHRREKCVKVLRRLNGGVKNYDPEREYLAMQAEIEREEERRNIASKTTYREIFTFPNFRRTMAGAFAVSMLQFSGAGVIFSYATYFFQQAGIAQPFRCTVIVYTLLVFGTLCSSLYLNERFGRRALLLTGGTGCSVFGILIGGLGVPKSNTAINNAILAVICIWVLFYACCLAGAGWGASAELSSPRLRAKTTAFSQNFYQAFATMFGFVQPLMIATGPGDAGWGVKTMFLFGMLGGISTIINYFTLPEVRGRTYHEIDEMFMARIPPRKMKGYKTLVEQEGTKLRV